MTLAHFVVSHNSPCWPGLNPLSAAHLWNRFCLIEESRSQKIKQSQHGGSSIMSKSQPLAPVGGLPICTRSDIIPVSISGYQPWDSPSRTFQICESRCWAHRRFGHGIGKEARSAWAQTQIWIADGYHLSSLVSWSPGALESASPCPVSWSSKRQWNDNMKGLVPNGPLVLSPQNSNKLTPLLPRHPQSPHPRHLKVACPQSNHSGSI